MPNMCTRKLPIRRIIPHISAMPARPQHYAALLGAWLLATITLGAWSSHFFYNGGKALAEVAQNKSINTPLDWLAGVCDHAVFADFYRFSIFLSMTAGAVPFWRWLTHPANPLRQELRALLDHRSGWKTAVAACFVCIAFTIATTALFHGRENVSLPRSWMMPLFYSLILAVPVELLFRGIAWRMISAACSIRTTILVSALLFSLCVLLVYPPGIQSWEPELSGDRLPLVRSLTTAIFDPEFAFLVLAMALGHARALSKSTWLTIGTMTGLLFSRSISPHTESASIAAVLTLFVFSGWPALRRPGK